MIRCWTHDVPVQGPVVTEEAAQYLGEGQDHLRRWKTLQLNGRKTLVRQSGLVQRMRVTLFA